MFVRFLSRCSFYSNLNSIQNSYAVYELALLETHRPDWFLNEEAIIAMETSSLVREALGEDVFEYVLRNKRAEWADYCRQVSAYELNRYLPVL